MSVLNFDQRLCDFECYELLKNFEAKNVSA